MQTLIPTLIIYLQVSLFQTTISVYDERFILIETIPDVELAKNISVAQSLLLINQKKNTITWFSEDLSNAYCESLPEQETISQNWKVMLERSNQQVEIIEETTNTNGKFLKVKFSEDWNGDRCSYTSEQFYLLYNSAAPPIPSHLIPFCNLPRHQLNLPEAYQNYKYVFQQWQADEKDGTTDKYFYINTTINTSPSISSYSIEELQAIPIVTKEEFHAKSK